MSISKERKQPPLWLLIIIFFLLFSTISIGLTFLFKLPWSVPIPLPWGIIIGVILLGLGFYIVIQALKALSVHRAFGKEIYQTKAKSNLITNGIYAHVRNPLYLGVIIQLFGWAFIFLFTFLLIMPFFFMLLFFFVARWEEKELIERFGEEYLAYTKAVPRFFPRFRKHIENQQ
ncbi:MAG: isoprenylcysteine carboxylmethyltransferase family protein [Candidatus Helarchaeota archaeon]|nr:isoprenylcysteine carboxylmethyltransferase family protein [Candidatus Helarchaeota archaeon]